MYFEWIILKLMIVLVENCLSPQGLVHCKDIGLSAIMVDKYNVVGEACTFLIFSVFVTGIPAVLHPFKAPFVKINS